MSVHLESYFENDQSLIGAANTVTVNTVQTSNTGLDAAVLLAQDSIDLGRTDIIEVRFPNDTVFQIIAYEWAAIGQWTAGVSLSGAADFRRKEIRDQDGETSVYFGRTSSNQVLIQSVDWEFDTAQPFLVSLHSIEYDGGLLDHRIGAVGTRHTIVMQARNATRPTLPTGSQVKYNGRYVETAMLAGGINWYTLNNSLTGTDTLWFIFGEATYNIQTGRWEVQDSWIVVDTTDRTNVTFSHAQSGPWASTGYDHSQHNYARIRRADGSFAIRSLTPTSQTLEREWQLLSETYIDGSDYRAEPYTTRLFFDLHPDEFRLMKVSFDWENYSDDISGVTYYDRCTGFIDPNDIVIAAEADRLPSAWDTKRHGPTWRWQFIRDGSAHLTRFADNISGGAAHNMIFQCQFENSSTTGGAPPATHWRVLERTTGSDDITGWIRIWVL